MTEGMEGRYNPLKIDDGALSELRDVAGPAPVTGKHWVMVDLDTGILKWYQSSKKRSFGGYRSYRRRY